MIIGIPLMASLFKNPGCHHFLRELRAASTMMELRFVGFLGNKCSMMTMVAASGAAQGPVFLDCETM